MYLDRAAWSPFGPHIRFDRMPQALDLRVTRSIFTPDIQPEIWHYPEQRPIFFQKLSGLDPVLMVDPPASKETVTHHVLSEQIDDGNQYRYE